RLDLLPQAPHGANFASRPVPSGGSVLAVSLTIYANRLISNATLPGGFYDRSTQLHRDGHGRGTVIGSNREECPRIRVKRRRRGGGCRDDFRKGWWDHS